jgi:hypothetical protein
MLETFKNSVKLSNKYSILETFKSSVRTTQYNILCYRYSRILIELSNIIYYVRDIKEFCQNYLI